VNGDNCSRPRGEELRNRPRIERQILADVREDRPPARGEHGERGRGESIRWDDDLSACDVDVPEDDLERRGPTTRRDGVWKVVVAGERGLEPFAMRTERQIATLGKQNTDLRRDLIDVLRGEVVNLRGDFQS